MSHFAVMVIGGDVEEQLSKYDENLEAEEYYKGEVSEDEQKMMLDYYEREKGETFSNFDECYARYGEEWNDNCYKKDSDGKWKEYSTYNPFSKWDWWQVGGRFSGAFITHIKKNAKVSDENYGEPSWCTKEIGIDSIEKKHIDFEAIRKDAETNARKRYRNIARLFDNGEIPKVGMTWAKVCELFKDMTLDEKRNIYNAQTAVIDWNKAKEDDKNSASPVLGFFASIDDYQMSEEEYVKKAGDESFVPFAVVRDGEWYERGKMGWWATVTNEKEPTEWNEIVRKLLDETDDDELITIVDCHI